MQKYIFSIMTAFAVSLLFCRLLIPILRRLKAGQNILVYVKEHKSKGGTPTMGGIAFVFAAIISAFLFVKNADRSLIVTLVVALSFMIVGLLDDFLKRKHKENLGLRAWQKFVFQMGIAVFCGLYCYRAGCTELNIPFMRKTLDVAWWIIPLSAFVFVAIVNAVNLTDGLDGLAAGTSVPFFGLLGVLILLQNGTQNLAMTSFCVMGSLLAYLLFNVHPASVFMGDTGSLALGGFGGCICVFSGNTLYLPILGICFVFSVISVIVQVIYYKATGGKRVFLMAPIHHHFQKKGFSESRIAYAYFLITSLVGALCVAVLG